MDQKALRSLDLKKIRWYVILRMVTITALLGTTSFIVIYDKNAFLTTTLLFLYFLIGLTFAFSLISFLLLKFKKKIPIIFFSYLQIIWDILFSTGVVYITDGVHSAFSFMYLLNIINGGILLYKKGSLITGYVSSLLYSTIFLCQYYNLIPFINSEYTLKQSEELEFLIRPVMNIFAFLIVSYLSGYLSEILMRTSLELEIKKRDIEKLNNLNRRIIQNLENAIIIVDSKLFVVFFNEDFKKLVSKTDEYLIGKKIDSVLSFMDSSKLNFILNASYNQKHEGWDVKYWPEVGKKQLYLNIRFRFLHEITAEEKLIMFIIRDDTEFMEIQEKMRIADKLAAIGRLAAGIAHEIRNPLTSISGSIQLLNRELKFEDSEKKLMDIICREIDRLNLLITDFLSFAKPGPINKKLTNLSDIILETEKIFLTNLNNKKIKLTVNLPEPIHIFGDEMMLKQLIWNLLKNSYEAISDQTGEIEISLRKNTPNFIELKIIDNGSGITEANKKKIFEPFFTTKAKGTGLGLSIVFQIVEYHNGSIKLVEKNEGTEFQILIPSDLKE